MKKSIVLIFVFVLMFSIEGCKKPSEIVEEKLAEKAAEEMLGGDVDIDGEQVTVTDENGVTTTYGGTEWPKGTLGSKIPEYKDGIVTYVTESDANCMIQMENVIKEDFEEYLNAVEEAGFTENCYNTSYDGGLFYTADNGEGITINLSCDYEANELMITITQE